MKQRRDDDTTRSRRTAHPEENASLDEPIRRVITQRARKGLREFLDTQQSAREVLDNMPKVGEVLWKIREDLAPACVEVIEQGDQSDRLHAAAVLLVMHKDGAASLISREDRVLAEATLVAALSDPNPNVIVEACIFMESCGAPDDAVEALRALLANPMSGLAVLAASVLSARDSEELEALRILERALVSNEELNETIAACAMVRLGVRSESAGQAVLARFKDFAPASQYFVLSTARRIGVRAGAFYAVAVSILRDETAIPGLRQMAARALGNITQGSSKATPVLLDALRYPDWGLVWAVMEGLEESQQYPAKAVTRMMALLSHEDENWRGVAAAGLRMMGSHSAPAIPALIDCLAKEHAINVIEALIEALAGTGEAAIEGLITFIRRGDPFNTEFAMRALANMGSVAVPALTELLRTTDDVRTRKGVMIMFALMRQAAAPAVPLLAETLEGTLDDELFLHTAICLVLCGRHTAPAIPTLVSVVGERGLEDEVVDVWIMRALLQMRDLSIPALRTAIQQAEGEYRHRLEIALARIQPLEAGNWNSLERLAHDDFLAQFLDVGNVLTEYGATSWRQMETILREKAQNGQLSSGYSGLSDRALAVRTEKLEDLLNTKLTTHGNNRKGDLTDEGRRLLAEVRDYLSSRDTKTRTADANPNRA